MTLQSIFIHPSGKWKIWNLLGIYIVFCLGICTVLAIKLKHNAKLELEKLPKFENHSETGVQHLHFDAQAMEIAPTVDSLLKQGRLYGFYAVDSNEFLLEGGSKSLSFGFDPIIQGSTDGRAYLYALSHQIREKLGFEIHFKTTSVGGSLENAQVYTDAKSGDFEWSEAPSGEESPAAMRSRIVGELNTLANICSDISTLNRQELIASDLPMQISLQLWPLHLEVLETEDFDTWSQKLFPSAHAQKFARKLLIYGMNHSALKKDKDQAKAASLFFSQMKSQIASLNLDELNQIYKESL